MLNPPTVKLIGTIALLDTISLTELQRVIAEAQAVLQAIGPATLVLKIGRQELRA